MGLMFSLAVRYIANYRDELGDYYSDRPFCSICMGDNGNTEVGDSRNCEINNNPYSRCYGYGRLE